MKNCVTLIVAITAILAGVSTGLYAQKSTGDKNKKPVNNLALEHANKAFNYTAVRDYENAIKEYTAALKFDSTNSSYYSSRGLIYKIQNKYSNAVADYRKASLLSPSAQTWVNLAEVYEIEGKHDNAIETCNVALELEDSITGAYQVRAMAYSRKKEYKKAVSDYSALIRRTSANTKDRHIYYYNRGLNYYYMKEYYSANLDSRKVIAIQPDYSNAYILYYYSNQKLLNEVFDGDVLDQKTAERQLEICNPFQGDVELKYRQLSGKDIKGEKIDE